MAHMSRESLRSERDPSPGREESQGGSMCDCLQRQQTAHLLICYVLMGILLLWQKMANTAVGIMGNHCLLPVLKFLGSYAECHKSLRPGGHHLYRHMLHVSLLCFHSEDSRLT